MTEIEHADVVVVGAGTIGSMALWQLSTVPGLKVVGVEQFGRAHGEGSFAGESRLFRVAYKEGDLYVPLLLAARSMWDELAAASGRDVFLPTGALSIGAQDQPEMLATLQTIERHALEHELLDSAELQRRFPQHAARDGDFGIFDPLGGGIRPEVAVLSALELAERAGVVMHYGSPVVDIEQTEAGVRVYTENRTIVARRAIVTTGSWTPRVMPELADLLRVQRLCLTWFMPDDISAFTADRFPVFMRDIGSMHFFGAPTLDGYSVKVSPGHDGLPAAGSLAELPPGLPPDVLARIAARVSDFFPKINPTPVRSSAHHDCFTADRTPIIDLNASGQIAVATGFSGHGFKLAPIFGKLLADLAVDGHSPLADPAFSLEAHRQRQL